MKLTTKLFVSGVLLAGVIAAMPESNPLPGKKPVSADAEYAEAEWEENEAKEEAEESARKRTMMREAFELEKRKTMDPALGYVPRERLTAAMEYMRRHGSSRAAIAGINWSERGPTNVSGRTRTVLVDPNDATGRTVWVGSVGGGLFKTTDITATAPAWTAVDPFFANLAISSLAADPSNAQVMYFSTGEGYFNLDAIRGLGIWKTTNGGTSWTQLANTNNANFYYVQKLVVNSTGIIMAATSTGLRRSVDGGTTWTKVLGSGLGITGANSNFCYDVEIAANGDVYASLDGSIHRSTNAGANWSAAQTLPITAGRIELACAPSDLNYLYAVVENANAINGILRTTNQGTNWVTRTEPADADPGVGATDFSRGQAWYDISVAVDPNNRDALVVGGVDLFKSTDGAGTWSQISHWYGGFSEPYVHADQHLALYQPGSSDVLYFTNDGGLWRTTNATAGQPTIAFKGDNYNVTQFYACALHPTAGTEYFLAGAQDNGSQKFTQAGLNATVEATGGDGAFCHIDQDQPQYQFTAYVYNDFYRSADGGGTWTNFSTSGGDFISPTDYDDVGNRMYISGGNNNYIRWDNPQTGATFTTVAATAFGGYVTCVTVSPNTANRVFFGSSNGDFFRVDNAHTATPTITNISTGLPTGYCSNIEVQTGDDNHLLAVYSNYGINSIWESVNGGTSWTSVEGNLPDMPIRWALFNPNNLDQALVATELGVWSTDNLNGGTTNWGATNTGMANVRTDMLQVRASDKMIIAATHGRGVFSTSYFSPLSAAFTGTPPILYTTRSVQFNDGSYGPVTSWSWNFGDATSATTQNPSHVYSTAGQFSPSLSINSGASSVTRTNYIQVLPDRGTPYVVASDGGTFEINPLDFGAWNVTGTQWQRGSSAVAGKNGTFSGTNAWVTGLTGAYLDNTVAYLYAPSHNFTAAGTYTFRFRARYNCETNYDGFNVEYSLDKGLSWTVLGTSGAGWYNFANAAGGTAFPTGVPFFTGNASASFTQYSRDVSFLAGNANVAFRFVFKTDAGVTTAGVAIDDYEILGPNNSGGLPAEMSPLQARWDGDDALLTWNTYSEHQNAGFVVERSTDAVSFTQQGWVAGAGTTTTTRAYSFSDLNPGTGTWWYRIRQRDEDGTEALSNIAELTRTASGAELLVYPSPARDQVTVSLHHPSRESVTVTVMDVQGREITRLQLDPGSSFTRTLDLQALGLRAGNYYVRAAGGGLNLVRPFTVQ